MTGTLVQQTYQAGPVGPEFRITAVGYEAWISQVGATINTFTHEGNPLVAGFGPDSPSYDGRGQVLAPWPNRVQDGRYVVDGVERQLALTEPDRSNALHGLVRWQPWRLKDYADDSVTLAWRLYPQQGWDWTLDMQVTYAVGEGGLTVDVTARNGGTGVAPFGYGAHPYLMAGEATVDELTLTVPADSVCEMDLDQLVPVTGSARTSLRPVEQTGLDFRAPRSLDGAKLDAAFTSLPAQWVMRLDGPRAVELWADAAFPWAQVFTGDSLPAGRARNTGVAVEPMTCPPNALATGEWLIHLHPRQEWRGTWGIRPGRDQRRGLLQP